ncbi:hypothetical protein P3X83_28675 [Spongiactinospora sp. TRM90649]|nr:hypothetical protein [Spongiactinospora sp. TRM90649]
MISYAQAWRIYGARTPHRLACAGTIPQWRRGRCFYHADMLAEAAHRGGVK